MPSISYQLRDGYCSIKNSGFPHSEIFGSTLAYSSPKHIGVSPVLHRLLVPRHPPCALNNLIVIQKISGESLRQLRSFTSSRTFVRSGVHSLVSLSFLLLFCLTFLKRSFFLMDIHKVMLLGLLYLLILSGFQRTKVLRV